MARTCTASATRCSSTRTATSRGPEDFLALFFERSETSVAKGREFLQRIFTRTDDRDTPATLEVRDAQLDAITTWGIPDASRLDRLAGITQPVLVANGDNDRVVPTKNSHLLAERLPNARLKIYPDAGHGFLFQYPAEFAGEVERFLNDERSGSSTRTASGRSWVMMTGKKWRELDCRQAEGGRLRVRLLWNQRSRNLAIEVNDRGVERVLALRDPSLARNAFMHPFAYMR